MWVKRKGGRHNQECDGVNRLWLHVKTELEEEEEDIGEKTLYDIAEEEEKDVYDPAVLGKMLIHCHFFVQILYSNDTYRQ